MKKAQTSSLREPVYTTRNDIKLTILQVVADAEQTTIIYTVDAPDRSDSLPNSEMVSCEPICRYVPDYVSHVLRLPDVQVLPSGSRGPDPDQPCGPDGSTRFKADDPPLPQGMGIFTFVLDCNQGEATVHLMPTSEYIILLLNTVPFQPTKEVPDATIALAILPFVTTTPVYDFEFGVESYVELDDGYVLVGC